MYVCIVLYFINHLIAAIYTHEIIILLTAVTYHEHNIYRQFGIPGT